MKTRYAKLRVIEDPAVGEIGLICDQMPMLEDIPIVVDGYGIAHDLLEHVNGVKNIGTIADECEALGACWYIRGQWGDLRRNNRGIYNPEQSLGHDVVSMYEDHERSPCYDLLSTRPTRAIYDDDALTSILDYSKVKCKAFRNACLSRMRIGYRKAYRKYEKYGRFYANSLFYHIQDGISEIKDDIEYVGQTFRLTYGGNEPRASVEEIYV